MAKSKSVGLLDQSAAGGPRGGEGDPARGRTQKIPCWTINDNSVSHSHSKGLSGPSVPVEKHKVRWSTSHLSDQQMATNWGSSYWAEKCSAFFLLLTLDAQLGLQEAYD